MIAVTGATGFLGKHIVQLLAEDSSSFIKGLTRQQVTSDSPNVSFVCGALEDPGTLHAFIEPGCTVINLAYSNVTAPADAIQTTEKLIELCAAVGIKRLIHCSSVAVYGRQSGLVTETTPCFPYDTYGKTKLAIDQVLLDRTKGRFELVILRPTVVFGPGSEALVSLVESLLHQSRASSYLRSSLYGRRHMHLVPVSYVAKAFQFCYQNEGEFAGDIYNVSTDEHVLNNFRDVESVLMQALNIQPYICQPLPIPKFVLESVLTLLKRPVVNTQVIYSGQKLQDSCFFDECDLEAVIKDFAAAYGLHSSSAKLTDENSSR